MTADDTTARASGIEPILREVAGGWFAMHPTERWAASGKTIDEAREAFAYSVRRNAEIDARPWPVIWRTTVGRDVPVCEDCGGWDFPYHDCEPQTGVARVSGAPSALARAAKIFDGIAADTYPMSEGQLTDFLDCIAVHIEQDRAQVRRAVLEEVCIQREELCDACRICSWIVGWRGKDPFSGDLGHAPYCQVGRALNDRSEP